MAIIGIDLGTTNSLAAFYDEDGAHMIPNRLGDHLTPSVISMADDGQIYVGKIAQERQITYPERTVATFKRSMGSQKKYHIGNRDFLPEELSSLIIRSLKEDAERYLNEPVTEAVISVPAYFNDVQRKATKHAGEMAGLKVERLINEPTAAAISYGLGEKQEKTKFLVFDLGGGTFDVSILELFQNIMEVRGVAGDNYLGGEDFTEVLMMMFIKELNLKVEDMTEKERATLRKQAEIAKRSFHLSHTVEIKCRIKDEERTVSISLDSYERSCELLLARLRRPIERALSDAAIKVRDIDSIVMVGGATKLSFVRRFVGKLFGKVPSTHINPDEVVGMGAALQAAMKQRYAEVKEIVLTDVCPYSLGTNISVEKPGGYFESGHFLPIIERNTVIPVSRTDRLYTLHDNQNMIRVEVLQGESRFAKDNILLGELNIPIPMAPRGEQSVDLRYTYDINGLLEVEVTVLSTGAKKRLVIEKNPGYLSEDEVQQRLKELESIKIHPRDQEENKLLLSRGERMYEEHVGDVRMYVASCLEQFEEIMEKQDPLEVREAAKILKEQLDSVEEDWL